MEASRCLCHFVTADDAPGWQGGSPHGYRASGSPGIAAVRMASVLAPIRRSAQSLSVVGLLRELKANHPGYTTKVIFNVG